MKFKLLNVSYIEFKQNKWKELFHMWKIPFKALLKLCFIMGQIRRKSELPDKFK
jgi:hypothetical protein